jgi:predicted MPP superfamily phosphohydrolase
MFPELGRPSLAPAPGGTTRTRLGQGWTELDRVERTEHVVPIAGLAAPLTILHLSDVHLRGPSPWVDQLCAFVSAEHADLVALTGDIVTRGFDVAVADQFLACLPRTRLGTFAVIGNWEVWGGAPRDVWQAHLARHGIPLLHDRSVDLGPIQLIGTDDALSGTPDLDAAFADVGDTPAVVLSHSPILFPRLARPPVRLVLAGHTHAGQVRLPVVGPFFLPRGSGPYPGGWYEQEGVWLFVSRGIGWSIAPVRWRCPPEIASIRLVPA